MRASAIVYAVLIVGCSRSTAPSTQPESTQPVVTPSDSGGEGARACGTRGGVQCSADQFCDFGGDELCGATDKGGSCKPITQACTRIYMPVCGCDSRSYGNECEAHSHGVSVKHTAMCTPEECQGAGGTVKYSNGADIPKCGENQDQWSLSGGKEAVVCCVDKS